MTVYKITSHRQVAGKNAGETVTFDELTGCNIDALVQGGHLTPATTTKAVKVTKEQEQ